MGWLRKLFSPRKVVRIPFDARGAGTAVLEPPPGRRSPVAEAAVIEGTAFPEPLDGVGNLDSTAGESLANFELSLFSRVSRRIETGRFELPLMPSTSMTVLELAGNSSVRIEQVVAAVEADPVLSSELLKAANSVAFGGVNEARTLGQAIVRLGMRNLRGLILSLSMKSVIFRSRGLTPIAREVWRQSLSTALIARQLATATAIQPDSAFLIGQLQDIGKVPLLDLLREMTRSRMEVSRALVGRLFSEHHETAGKAMAERWNLPSEIVSVAGCHHDFERNEDHLQSAALGSLAHKIDLYLSLGSEDRYWELRLSDEAQVLGISYEDRRRVLRTCLDSFERSNE